MNKLVKTSTGYSYNGARISKTNKGRWTVGKRDLGINSLAGNPWITFSTLAEAKAAIEAAN